MMKKILKSHPLFNLKTVRVNHYHNHHLPLLLIHNQRLNQKNLIKHNIQKQPKNHRFRGHRKKVKSVKLVKLAKKAKKWIKV